MRAGWMRPSASSFSSVIRAISRRTPSNADSTTALGRVVDDEVDAGEVLQRADVAALAADDAALHVVGRQLHDGDGRLGGVAAGEALHRDGEDRAHAALGVALGLLLDLAHVARALVADLVGDLGHEPLLGLARAQAGDLLQRRLVLAPAAGELLALGLQRARLVVELAGAAVELLGAAAYALLQARELVAAAGRRLRARNGWRWRRPNATTIAAPRIAAATISSICRSSSPRARSHGSRPRGAVDVRGRTGRASGGSRQRRRCRALEEDELGRRSGGAGGGIGRPLRCLVVEAAWMFGTALMCCLACRPSRARSDLLDHRTAAYDRATGDVRRQAAVGALRTHAPRRRRARAS